MTDNPDIPRPPGRPLMRMTWSDLLLVHWAAPADRIQALLPDGLTVDTFDGRAWIGLVPFTMSTVHVPPLPAWSGAPTMRNFPECNVRTYVRCESDDGVERGGRGVWFFTLDASSRLAVHGARMLWNLNYRRSTMSSNRDGDEVSYRVERHDHHKRSHLTQRYKIWNDDREPNMQCRWRIRDEPATAPMEMQQFLTDRFSLYTTDRKDRVTEGRIVHPPWRLLDAELLELQDTLIESIGLPIERDEPPVVFAAEPVTTDAWRPRRVE